MAYVTESAFAMGKAIGFWIVRGKRFSAKMN
jgi:hypothetical protein